MPMRVAFDPEIDLVVTAPQLPVGGYDAVVAIAGIFVRGAGFVPIGLGAGMDVVSGGEYLRAKAAGVRLRRSSPEHAA